MTLSEYQRANTLTAAQMTAFQKYRTVQVSSPEHSPEYVDTCLRGITSRWRYDAQSDVWNLISFW